MPVLNPGWPEMLAAGSIILFSLLAVRRGLVAMLVSLGTLVVSFVLAFALYPALAAMLSSRMGWSPVWSTPAAFALLWLLFEGLLSAVGTLITSRLLFARRSSPADRVLAVFPGALQGLLFAALLLTVMAVAPVGGSARRDIMASPVGSSLVQATLDIERPLENIFGPAARETLGFITVKPPATAGQDQAEAEGAGQGTEQGHDEGIKLNFNVDNPPVDAYAEQQMLDMVNGERTSRGLRPLEMDAELRLVARAHALDMFRRGYFAHNTPEGTDPFQRMRAAHILYGAAGENLALAPTLDMAHSGLMNSPGHRANILNGIFGRVGIGVLDGGIYGKMFVQEFTD